MKEFSPEWFESSSKAWLANKKRVGYMYYYVCSRVGCKRRVLTWSDVCSRHSSRHSSLPMHQPPASSLERPNLQETLRATKVAQRQHTGGSPTVHQDLSVADRVVRRRRGLPFQ
jgi:hypothetical protein